MQRLRRRPMYLSSLNRKTQRTRQMNLRLETLEARVLLAGDAQILFLGNDATPTAGADGDVMQFLETNYGAQNVDYKRSTLANNTTDIANIDLLEMVLLDEGAG